MNKLLFVALTALCSFSAVSATTCSKDVSNLFKENGFIDMKDKCTLATEGQIKKEITASIKYLSMAAYFSKDSVNRPGFAKLFFDAAGEEREHALKLIEYLSMRGRYLGSTKSSIPSIDISALVKNADDLSPLGLTLVPLATTDDKTSSGLIALQNALKLEVAVTKSIRSVIDECEKTDDFNHYHFVDYLTGEFLEEQYKGQRDLAGKISTLAKMVNDGQGAKLADFLFDKQLL